MVSEYGTGLSMQSQHLQSSFRLDQSHHWGMQLQPARPPAQAIHYSHAKQTRIGLRRFVFYFEIDEKYTIYKYVVNSLLLSSIKTNIEHNASCIVSDFVLSIMSAITNEFSCQWQHAIFGKLKVGYAGTTSFLCYQEGYWYNHCDNPI